MNTPVVPIPCQGCGAEAIERVEQLRENGVVVDLYKCGNEECGRKAVIIYEPTGGYSEDQQTFIQKEVARRGAFFPSDFTGGNRFRR